MLTLPPADVQKAIAFLSELDPRHVPWESLPDRFDEEAVAALARRHGVEVDGAALREAFRMMMIARRLAGAGGSTPGPRGTEAAGAPE
jgi:hypothetical protein